MNPLDPTRPKDRQQLWNTGDVVLRSMDLSGHFWKRGTIGEVTCTPNSYSGEMYQYQVLWDDGTVGENYLGSSFCEPPVGTCVLPGRT